MLIDSHCHLDFPCFDYDRQNVIEKCSGLGIDTIVVPGTEASSWQNIIALSRQFTALKPAFGLHPYFLAGFEESHLDELVVYLDKYKSTVVAVGEIGLDRAISVDISLQKRVFERQLDIAHEADLPVIIHHRRSHNDIIKTLKHLKFSGGGIIHAFSGSLHEALTYQDLGFKLGVGGLITYPRGQKTRKVVGQVPLDLLVLETDAPDMPVFGQQGKRNTPENIPMILAELASLREESADVIALQCRQNVLAVLQNITTV
ncbi:TatD family hydrolase [Flavobacterium sp. W21_SRS_FM6]|uniref:TatD family hydrolase n=1 Tax=Flavobacterium sp. W21_SRS_FM6 TaxID=3240268 RepID=UPI003F8EE5F3